MPVYNTPYSQYYYGSDGTSYESKYTSADGLYKSYATYYSRADGSTHSYGILNYQSDLEGRYNSFQSYSYNGSTYETQVSYQNNSTQYTETHDTMYSGSSGGYYSDSSVGT